MQIKSHDNVREDEMKLMEIPWKKSLIVLLLFLGFLLLLWSIR
jgi:hypothetical protein